MVVDIDKDVIRDKTPQLRFHRTNGDDTIRKGIGIDHAWPAVAGDGVHVHPRINQRLKRSNNLIG